jgi:hypothetical protein
MQHQRTSVRTAPLGEPVVSGGGRNVGVMFERVQDMPRAIVAHKADDPVAYERAVQWTLAHSQRLGGHPLLYVPGKRNFQDELVLVRMSKRVTVARGRR